MNRPAILVLSAAFVLVACNRGGSSDTGPTAQGSTKPTGLKVVYIPKSTGISYFDEIDKGFKQAQAELGYDYAEVAPAKADPTSQIPDIKDQIQQGVDVLAISANDKDALVPVLDQAKAKGITVITVDADITGNESHRDVAVLQTDAKTIGQSQIELLGSLIGYKGDFAILSAQSNAPNQNAWIAAMNDTLKDPKYAGMHLVATVYGDDEAQKSTSECEGLLSRYPNLRGIISPTSVGLAAAAQVVETRGVYPGGPHAVGGGLQLTGLSTPNQLKSFVTKGEVTKFQLWLPSNMGYLAGYLGSLIHSGKLKPAPGATFTTPKVKPDPIGPNNVVYGGPLITFDKSNIDQYSF
jgi:rhamnose transport system substrate-binding protein